MSSLEEYFARVVRPPEEAGAPLMQSESEQAFMEKYLGLHLRTKAGAALSRPAQVEAVAGFAPREGEGGRAARFEEDAAREEALLSSPGLVLIGFALGGERFAAPMEFTGEIIRETAPVKLPGLPPFMSGIVNLRGRLTPMLDLAALFRLTPERSGPGFVIVCRFAGLSLGLVVDKMGAMLRLDTMGAALEPPGEDAPSASFLAATVRHGGASHGIISLRRLYKTVMQF